MYKLKEISNKETWNNFVFENNFAFYSFLSSWEWAELQTLSGKRVLRFWIYEFEKTGVWEKLIWILPLIVNKAKRWTYLFSPHCPLILNSEKQIKIWDPWIREGWKILEAETRDYFFEILDSILDELKGIASKIWANFIRFNSPVKNTIKNKKFFEKLGFIDAPMHEHAEDTHLLDLTKTEEELLQNIKKKDRYYINRAIKEWVQVLKWNSPEQIKNLTSMHLEHSKKVWYHPFSASFIKNLYETFWDNITTISASYNWKVESILMTIKFWKTCVYYIAASDIKSSKFSPNYLCQWEAIKQAKADWCTTYNFWWVSPDHNPNHPIAWVTKFKRKFWGYDYSLLHAQDLIISKKYWFNFAIETFRRKKRWYYYKKPV